jgi:hypothetical protein
MSNGDQFEGLTGYEAQNSTLGTWTVGALNYIWVRISQINVAPYKGIESDIGGFPDNPDVIPLWILDIDGAGAITSILDARPWFDGGAGSGSNSSEERLKEILQHSVMEDFAFDALSSTDFVDGASTGSLTGPNQFELAPGETLISNFGVAPPDHLSIINQPYVAVLTDQIIDDVNDIDIKVSRVASPGAPFPGPNANWVSVPSNFSLVDLESAPGTNVLNIAIRNISAFTYAVNGWGIYSNPTATTEVPETETIINTEPLQGKTFIPVESVDRYAGVLYYYSTGVHAPGTPLAPVDLSGTLNLATGAITGDGSPTGGYNHAPEGPRPVPENATHAVINFSVADMNVTGAGAVAYTVHAGPDGALSGLDADYSVCSVNSAPGGEGSNTATGSITVAIDPTNPVIDWALFKVLQAPEGDYTFLLLNVTVEGFYIDEFGTGLPLEGKTFVPVETADRILRAGGPSSSLPSGALPAGSGGTAFLEGGQLNLGSLGVTRPSNATHALITGFVRTTFQGGDPTANGYAALHISPYNATPSAIASGIYAICSAGQNSDSSPPNGDIDTSYGSIVIPLGDTIDPDDLTYAVFLSAIPLGGFTADDVVDYGINIEGFYIDENAASLQATPLEGHTFVIDKRVLFDTARDNSNKSGTYVIPNPPENAEYAVIRMQCDVDAGNGSFVVAGAVGPTSMAPNTAGIDYVAYLAQMSPSSNAFEDDISSVIVPINETTLGAFNWYIYVTSGTIGSGTTHAQFALEGWYIRDSGAVPAALEGKTFIPQPATEKMVYIEVTGAVAGPDTFDVDFDNPPVGAVAVTPPDNATHALVNVLLDADCSSGQGNFILYGNSYGFATPNNSLQITEVSCNTTVENNVTNTGMKVLPLNIPANPSGDLSFYLDRTGSLVAANNRYQVHVEGWYIDDVGIGLPELFVGMAAERAGSVSTSGGALNISGYTSTEYDSDSAFNPTTGVYTVPVDGIYQVSGWVLWNATVGLQQRDLNIVTSAGTHSSIMGAATSETDPSQQRIVTLQLSAGNTIYLSVASPSQDQPIVDVRFEVRRVG